jgi:hypothetical protein
MDDRTIVKINKLIRIFSMIAGIAMAALVAYGVSHILNK